MEHGLWTMFAAMWRLLVFLAAWLAAISASAAPLAPGDPSIDRSTPRRAFTGFESACARGDDEHAAKYLDVRALPHKSHAELAGELCYVLAKKAAIDPQAIPDEPEASGGSPRITLASIVVDEEPVPIDLAHVHFDDGVARWVIARETVAAIPQLAAAYGPRGLEEHIPSVLRERQVLTIAPWQWIGLAFGVALAFALARLIAWLVIQAVMRVVKRTSNKLDDHLVLVAKSPLRMLVAVASFRALLPLLALGVEAWNGISHALSALTVFAFAWLLIRMMRGGADYLEERASEGEAEYKSRGLRTQLTVLYRVASIVIMVIAVAAILLQFEVVRSIGTSLLASAGIAGITLGLAAQKSLGAIIAGIQISIAQPVRIGDTVVVDGQQGIVEEIHLTYIVLRLTDDRRLVAPIGRFLDQSFENWTKLGSALRGYVMIPTDFAIPVDTLRAELERICKASSLWDGRSCRLEVTDVTSDKALVLRATVSARNSDALWDLRCEVREALVRFLVGLESGKHLPRVRTQSMSS
jgi:small-conductance mechanosensitive channel